MMSIYCPKCGSQSSEAQKFCRQCGQDLNAVSSLIKGPSNIEVWRRGPMIWGLSLFIGSAALGSVVKILSKEGIRLAGEFTPYLMAFLILTIFGGMGLMICSFLPLIRCGASQPSVKANKTTSRDFAALPARMPAVAEPTTELFEERNSAVLARAAAPEREKV